MHLYMLAQTAKRRDATGCEGTSIVLRLSVKENIDNGGESEIRDNLHQFTD